MTAADQKIDLKGSEGQALVSQAKRFLKQDMVTKATSKSQEFVKDVRFLRIAIAKAERSNFNTSVYQDLSNDLLGKMPKN